MKSSCQAFSGFLGCPSLSFAVIRPFIWGVLFRQYHGSEAGPWNGLVALHRSARVEWSPRKCQISLIFSDLFTDFTRSWHEWEEWSGRRIEPHIFTLHREQEWKTQCRMAMACSGTLSSGSHRGPWLAVPCVTPPSTAFQDSSCIMAYASPSCSLRNLGGRTENIILRAVLQPGQIQLTPFFLIFPSSSCVSSCPV